MGRCALKSSLSAVLLFGVQVVSIFHAQARSWQYHALGLVLQWYWSSAIVLHAPPALRFSSNLLSRPSDGCARNEEPLVDTAIDRSWRDIATLWNLSQLAVINAVWRAWVGDIRQAEIASLGLARDESVPGIAALPDDLERVLAVLALAAERELVLWLSVWDLVDAEPFIRRAEEAWQVALNVLDVVQLRRERVVDVDDHDLPVCLFFVEEGHHAEDFDLLDLACIADELADLADVEGVVVALGFGLGVDDVGVFPGLDWM